MRFLFRFHLSLFGLSKNSYQARDRGYAITILILSHALILILRRSIIVHRKFRS